MVVRCSEADLVDNYCEILKEFEERANNRICYHHTKELAKATEELLRANGMLAEVRKALDNEWEEEDTDTDDDDDDDDYLAVVSEDGFGYDGHGLYSHSGAG
jgi:phage tail protein X